MKNRLIDLEQKSDFSFSKILMSNMKKIAKLINLNNVEKQILIFSIYIKYYDNLFDNTTRLIGDVSTDRLHNALGILLDIEPAKIKSALSSNGILNRSGLVTVDSGSSHIYNKIDLLSREFVDNMMNANGDIEEIIKDSVRRCSETKLTINDFDYIKKDIDVIIPYMRYAVENKQTGVNVLLYGRPGTGKTELSKVIANELKIDIFEVSYTDMQDRPITGNERLKAYKAGQSFFASEKILLMFDEIEDVIGDDVVSLFFQPKKQKNKAWMNRTLETNQIPTIWITNDIYSIDSALIRRFDLTIEVSIPPKLKREAIIKKECNDIFDDNLTKRIAANENIAPAVISRAAKVIQSIEYDINNQDEVFENIINNTLKAQGYDMIKKSNEDFLPTSYDVSYINTNANLQELASGVKLHPNARICLYGVPGTGKSAFGKWIADYINRPLLLKKGSDLFSMWVGGTEKNIASAFKEATEEEAVLVFDEVDSFLQDRRSAKQSWELTQVNEMLVQMENFNGVFIATTNLMSGLDQASLRRFDLKLEFGYMKEDQAWDLYQKECKNIGIKLEKNSGIQDKLKSLNHLTPGDFAAVNRQHRFRPISSAYDYLERLAEEVIIKNQNTGKQMGFKV